MVGARAAPALVVAVYFLALAAGSLLGGVLASRARRPLAVFGLCAGIAGAWSLGLGFFFRELQPWSAALAAALGSQPAALLAGRFAVALLWLYVPAAAAGAAWPAIVGELERFRADGNALLARFYAWNLLGAALAAAAAPYVLFPAIGLTKSAALAGGMDLALCAFTLVLANRSAPRVHAPRPSGRAPRFLSALAFFSGFVLLVLEVLWVHLMGAVLGGSAFAFGAMLAAVLAALFAGSWTVARFRPDRPLPRGLYGAVLLAASGALALTFAGWDAAPGILLRWGPSIASFGPAELLRFTLALALIGPPAALLGMLYPLTFRLAAFPREGAEGAVGGLAAWNAMGCAAGALATGLWLLPAFGSSGAARCLAVALVLAAGIVAWPGSEGSGRRGRVAGLTLASLGAALGIVFWPRWDLLALTSGLHVSFREASVGPASRLLFLHEDLSGGMTTVVENPPRKASSAPVRVLLSDGKFQGEDGENQAAQVLLGLLPAVHRAKPASALVIGLGTGQSAEVVAASGAGRVVVADIAPGIGEASRRFFGRVSGGLFSRPGVSFVLEDGRNLLLRSPERFDVIATQVNSAWFSGAGSLYSREFYEVVRRRLTPDGVFEQWVPLHHVAPEDVASSIATLSAVFPHVALWRLSDQGYLLASPAKLSLDAAALESLGRDPQMAKHLSALEAFDSRPLSDIARLLLLDEGAARRVSEEAARRGIPIATDSNRRIEYAAARAAVGASSRTPEILEGLRLMAGAAPTQRD